MNKSYVLIPHINNTKSIYLVLSGYNLYAL